MKKNLLPLLMLAWLLCLGIAPAFAQQNQKIVFDTPANFQSSGGSLSIPTSDGGYLVLGNVDFTDWNTVGIDQRPRAVKLNANLDTEWDNLYVAPPPGKGGLTFPFGEAFELPDGDLVFGLHNDSSDVHVLRLNSDGSLDNAIALPGFQRDAAVIDVLNNGNLLVSDEDKIFHIAPDGSVAGTYTPPSQQNGGVPTVLANGNLLFYKTNFGLGTTTYFCTDNQCNLLWQVQPPAGIGGKPIAFPAGGFGLRKTLGSDWFIHSYDNNGAATGVSAALPGVFTLIGLQAYPNGELLASGTNGTNRGYLMRFALDGTVLWSAQSPEDGPASLQSLRGTPTGDGWGIGAGATLDNRMGFLRVSNNTGFVENIVKGTVRHDTDENCIADASEPRIQHPRVAAVNAFETFTTHANAQGEYTLVLPEGDFTIITNPDHIFFFQCPTAANTVSFPPGGNGNVTLDMPIQSLDIIHEIKGKVTIDQNDNCSADVDDLPAKHWFLKISSALGSYSISTNNAGEYSSFVPSGDYSVEVLPWNSGFGICTPAIRNVSLTGTSPQSQVEDFVADPLVDCANLDMHISGGTVRPCTTEVFKVWYRNSGTQTAENLELQVVLDPSLAYVSATPAPSSISGNVLQFDLADLAPQFDHYYKTVSIAVTPSCNLQIGQSVCVSANLTHDPCLTPAWQGAIVAVDGYCSNDSAYFRIRNVGNAPNVDPLGFVIIEDQIVLRQNTFQLPPGGEQIEGVLPMNDSTLVSIIAQQEPGAPGDTVVTFSLSNCQGMGGTPGGLGGNSGPTSDNQCFAVVNSFDPNDKQASPLGYGPEHLVRPGTPLEYTIRFQNTGNDTAFLVILRDTISDKMDVSRIEILSASHAFDFAQINNNILHFRFDNILLPDSLTNPEGSQGYVSFKIYPKAELPNGTAVDNRAAIYFDQNPPILTNTVRRSYGEYFVVSTDAPRNPEMLEVLVSPNPFVTETRFSLPEDAPSANYRLDLFDISGKLLRSLSFSGKTCLLQRENLPAGMHFWKISAAGKMLASGKIVAGE